MAYTPSFDDLPSASANGYSPSIEDLPSPSAQTSSGPEMVDTFLGKMPKNPRDATMMGVPMFPDRNNKEQQSKIDQALKERRLGAAQALANYPVDIYNLFAKEKAKGFDFAPHTEQAKTGAIAGDIASFFTPGGAAKGLLKGATYLPKVGEGVNALLKTVKANPWLRGGASVARTAGESALFNAAHNPEDAGNAALEGLGVGGGTQAAANLLTTTNPVIRALARLGVGTGIGYGFGHPGYGALAGIAAPEVAKVLGLGGKNALASEVLEGLSAKDVARAKAANDRLGTIVTPAQASGNYVTAATEGGFKKSPQGGQYGLRQEQLQQRQQGNAINQMLDTIYKSTPESEAKINALYEQAHAVDLDKNALKQIKSNPLWRDAISQAKKDSSLIAQLQREGKAFKPLYNDLDHAKAVLNKRIEKEFEAGNTEKAEKMLDNFDATASKMMKQQVLNENNYKFLDEAKTKLDDMYQSAINRGDLRQARRINDERKAYLEKLDELNPTYKEARATAQPRIVRRNIEEKFNKNEEDFSGKSFYSKFLNTRKSYQEILRDTKNFPEAQEAIKDMRKGWKHLSNIKTVSQGEAQSKIGLDQARDFWKATMGAIKKLAGARNDVQSLKFIYSPDWDKEFARIMQNKEKGERNRQLLTLMGKVALANNIDMIGQE